MAGRHGDHRGADLLPGLLACPATTSGWWTAACGPTARRWSASRRPSRCSGRPLEQIRLLSLGTTVAAAYRPRRLDRGGLIQWIRSPHVAQVLMAGQSLGAFTASEHLLGRGRAFRLNPPAPESLAKLDAR